jgi:hypothetical protein
VRDIVGNGGDSSTVNFVEIPFPAMPAALETGRIDAASVAEPFIGVAKKNGRIPRIFGMPSLTTSSSPLGLPRLNGQRITLTS